MYVGDGYYCKRVNTLEEYAVANRDIATVGASTFLPFEEMVGVLAPYFCARSLNALQTPKSRAFVDPTAEVSRKTQVGPGCCVGKGMVAPL